VLPNPPRLIDGDEDDREGDEGEGEDELPGPGRYDGPELYDR
jgi:hypothetical protein